DPRQQRMSMPKLLSALLATTLLGPTTRAQPEPPILKASSRTVQIMDGGKPMRGEWLLDPSVELDVYDAFRADQPKTVTVTTDIDSKSFEVEPGHVYDFVILLNGKDECKTRISTMTQSYTRAATANATGPVTIPITIQKGKLHLSGRINGSQPLDLIFDTGADTCAMYPSARSKGAAMTFDGTVKNAGSGGITVRQISRDNRLDIADVHWTHEPFIFIEKQADDADGIIGYPVFESRIVEFDYDRMLLVVHDSIPAHAAGFTRTAMPYAGTLTAVEVLMTSGESTWRGPFILDTAGNGTMLVNQAFATAHDMHSVLRKVGTSVSRGLGSGSIHSNQLMLPRLQLAGHALTDVPINVEVPSEGNKAPPGGVLCMDVLARFNTILDYPSNQAYFKPNARFAEPFRVRGSGPPLVLICAVAGGAMLLAAWAIVHRAKAKRASSLANRSAVPKS
ncbi:MAG: aspartyl protease family protein, partial [Phycisphaerales bacterium]